MGTCKDEMKPTPTKVRHNGEDDKNKKSLLGVFKKKPKKDLPPHKKFADYINDAYTLANDVNLSEKFDEAIKDATVALIRLIDIKEHELNKEKGREEYNRLALCRMVEMQRLLEHIAAIRGAVVDHANHLSNFMIERLLEHIGMIGAEYAEHSA